MSLTPPMEFDYLTKAERDSIEDAFINAEIDYDRDLRRRLLDGVNRKFIFDYLVTKSSTSNQLFSDLKMLSLVERLDDGTVPLALWLSNGIRRFGVNASLRALFEGLLKKVLSHESAAVTLDRSEVPAPVESEEAFTDEVDNLMEVSFLATGALRVPAVAKLLVPCYRNKAPVMDQGELVKMAGTGWLIASDLLMTNYHVIRNRAAGEPSDEDLMLQVTGAKAYFHYDRASVETPAYEIDGLIAAGKTKTTDYALLHLARKPDSDFLPVLEDEVKMPAAMASPFGKARRVFSVNIIQHPLGKAKRVALRNNRVYEANFPTLHYFTDTLEGSSGSPVFNDSWRVIALHRATVTERTEFNKATGYINQGIQMHAIFKSLEEAARSNQRIADELARIRREQQEKYPITVDD